MDAGKLGRIATGSPQPPPGGGLLLLRRRPLRSAADTPQSRIDPAGIGGPQLRPAKARNSRPAGPLAQALRKLRPDISFSCKDTMARACPREVLPFDTMSFFILHIMEELFQ